ncbi:hypothetical protein SK128_009079, partial [Halocaridina rubra]
CKTIISEGSHVQLSASSSVPWTRRKSCQPTDASLNSHRAWCARRKDEHQWLQWDLGPPHLVTGIITRGRGDTGRKHWVKAYTLTYSNDSRVWFTYKDGNHLDTKEFSGGGYILNVREVFALITVVNELVTQLSRGMTRVT